MAGIIFQDPEQQRIADQIEYAKALRNSGMTGTGGSGMAGNVYMVGNQWGNVAKTLGGVVMEGMGRSDAEGLQKARQAQRDQFLSQMPSRTETREQMGPVQEDQEFLPDVQADKPIRQYADEMQRYGMQALNVPGMESVGAQAIQYAMQAPEREAAQKERLEARQFELLQRAQAEKERQEREIAEKRARDEQNSIFRAMVLGQGQQRIDIMRDAQQNRADRAREKEDEKASAAEQSYSAGKRLIDSMETSVDELNRLGGIANTEKGSGSNVLAYAGNTGVGQTFGRMTGTKEQTLRDNLATDRRNLLAELKNVKNLPASMMNSNMELQNFLSSLGDGPVSYQTQKHIIEKARAIFNAGRPNSGRQDGVSPNATPVREVPLKDGRIGIEWSDGSRTIKNGN